MKELLEQLKNERKSYREMVDFCTDNIILNNYIVQELHSKDIYFDTYCGDYITYYNENGEEITQEQYYSDETGNCYEEQDEIYQYFIIDEAGAERFARYTNELVIYNEELDIYILCVKHWGTSWDYVAPNWKNEIED